MKIKLSISQRLRLTTKMRARRVAIAGACSMLAITIGLFVYFNASNIGNIKASSKTNGKVRLPGFVQDEALLTGYEVLIPQIKSPEKNPCIQHFRILKPAEKNRP